MKYTIVFPLLLFISGCAFASDDYPAVNHFTKELYVFSADEYEGIFWEPLDDTGWQEEESRLIAGGYKYTDVPHKSEYTIYGSALLVFMTLSFRKFFRKKKSF